MSSLVSEEKGISQNEGFERIIQLISECVSIKAQLQQYINQLDEERQKNRSLNHRIIELLEKLDVIKKNNQPFAALKETEILKSDLKGISLDRVANGMEETVAHFAKVMNDLQHHLVKMDLGSTAISIIQVLLTKVGEQVYAIPIGAVVEIFKTQQKDVYSIDGNDTVSLRGHALSVIDVSIILNLGVAEHHQLDQRRIVVIKNDDKRIGIVVDELLGQESVVFKKLPEQVQGIQGILGVSILGDGKIGLIVDCGKLIKMAGGKN